MSKKYKGRQKSQVGQSDSSETSHHNVVEIGRGQIQDNYLKALVTSKVFRSKVESSHKGKGSYQRHKKHRSIELYLMVVKAIIK